ncbi:thioesterase family protein [soil metagenome]
MRVTVFDTATSVTPDGPGRYTSDLGADWVVGGGINGGYLLATIGRALRASVPAKPDPFSVSAYYVSASRPGPADVDVRVLRDGGSVATLAADLSQGGEARISALATYGDLDRGADDVQTTAEEIDLPPRERCVPNTLAPPEFLEASPFLRRFDMLFHPDQVGWAVGQPDNSGVLSAWFRLEDGRDPDPLSLLLVLDALPPVMFTFGRMGWAPTLELTAHVRAKPAPGWLKVRHATRNIAGGMFEEDCEVWDSAGRLVAQSRQLARLPR